MCCVLSVSLIDQHLRGPVSSHRGIGFVNEVVKLPDGYIDMAGRRGQPSCSCILCFPLSPSPRNTWVMAYLYAVIRRTHTSPLTVKSHQNKCHHERTHRHSCSHYSQGEVSGWAEGRKMVSGTINRLCDKDLHA